MAGHGMKRLGLLATFALSLACLFVPPKAVAEENNPVPVAVADFDKSRHFR